MRDLLRGQNELSRRHFAMQAASALLGVGLLPEILSSATAHAAEPSKLRREPCAKNVIYLYMSGGQSHIDTWDPKEGVESAGPVRPIKTSADGIQLSEFLPLTAKQMHLGTVVRSLSSTQGAHEQGNYFMHTSYQQRGTILHPSLGAWLSLLRGEGNPTLPSSVYCGNASRHPGAGFFTAEHQPLFVNNPENGLKNIHPRSDQSTDKLGSMLSLASELDADFRTAFPNRNVKAYAQMYDRALSMMKSKDLVAFDLNEENQEMRKSYGKDPFGQGCLLARRLVERGVRFIEVSLHGWDTHVANFVRTPELCSVFDKALAALIADLHSRGMLKDTLVVVATEFGRTPQINSNTGRDHYPQAFSAAMFGGGVKAGAIFGKTDKEGRAVTENKLSIPDFNASIAYALGLPLDKVVTSPTQRPFTVADKGQPATQLFV